MKFIGRNIKKNIPLHRLVKIYEIIIPVKMADPISTQEIINESTKKAENKIEIIETHIPCISFMINTKEIKNDEGLTISPQGLSSQISVRNIDSAECISFLILNKSGADRIILRISLNIISVYGICEIIPDFSTVCLTSSNINIYLLDPSKKIRDFSSVYGICSIRCDPKTQNENSQPYICIDSEKSERGVLTIENTKNAGSLAVSIPLFNCMKIGDLPDSFGLVPVTQDDLIKGLLPAEKSIIGSSGILNTDNFPPETDGTSIASTRVARKITSASHIIRTLLCVSAKGLNHIDE